MAGLASGGALLRCCEVAKNTVRGAAGRSGRDRSWWWWFLLAVMASNACSSDPLEGIELVDPPPSTTSPTTARGPASTATIGQAGDDNGDRDETIQDVPPLGPIRIDQFGYRPADPKIAVIVDPELGYNAEVEFEPGGTIEVRRADDDEVVYQGTPQPWSEGAVHEQSGDRGWWFDFTTVSQTGQYYLIDPVTEQRTEDFEIAKDVYDDVFDAAVRMFWFNRANTAHPPDLAGPWADGAAYVGPGQDTEARSVDDRENAGTARDLSGGWFDAGDTNKYVTFASEPVHGLLAAYQRYPSVFGDDVGIPESGNGIPDVVDEVLWEVQWLERMQLDDGGVLTKVGLIDREPQLIPSKSIRSRYYEEVCSSSTIAAAGMYAHAAVVFSQFPALSEDATRLVGRAERAWDWYQDNPQRDDCDPQVVRSGDADLSVDEQADAEVKAAIYLYALTGSSRYNAAVLEGYDQTLPFTGAGFGDYGPDQADALLFYRRLPGASGSVTRAIDRRVAALADASPLFGFDPSADLYRSYLPDEAYHWGSNMVKANVGSANLMVASVRSGRERALGHLNYLHGVNPLGLVYLTNMEDLGAGRSVNRMFHFWFGEQTDYDVTRGSDVGVAPGFLVGGPNKWYSGATVPPAGQPPQKSFRDWSSYGSEPSWEILEPAIYYQSAYVRLLAAVMATG
jgi:hypothetical protein